MIIRRVRSGWLAMSWRLPFWLFVRPIGLVEQGENAAIGSLEHQFADVGELACLVVYRPELIDAEGVDVLQNMLAGAVKPQTRFIAIDVGKASARHLDATENDVEEPLDALVAQPLRIVLEPDVRIVHGFVSCEKRRSIVATQAAWRQACNGFRAGGNAEALSTGGRP